jgi:hypothetical protein
MPLSGAAYNKDETPFSQIDDFTGAFETYRTEKGDDAFECQDSSSIDASPLGQGELSFAQEKAPWGEEGCP